MLLSNEDYNECVDMLKKIKEELKEVVKLKKKWHKESSIIQYAITKQIQQHYNIVTGILYQVKIIAVKYGKDALFENVELLVEQEKSSHDGFRYLFYNLTSRFCAMKVGIQPIIREEKEIVLTETEQNIIETITWIDFLPFLQKNIIIPPVYNESSNIGFRQYHECIEKNAPFDPYKILKYVDETNNQKRYDVLLSTTEDWIQTLVFLKVIGYKSKDIALRMNVSSGSINYHFNTFIEKMINRRIYILFRYN